MHSTECNDNALVKMHYNAGKNIECNMCRIRRIMHNASIVRTRSKCKIARMFKNVIENSRMIYNALRIIGAKITRLWGKNHTPPAAYVRRHFRRPALSPCSLLSPISTFIPSLLADFQAEFFLVFSLSSATARLQLCCGSRG